MWSSTRATGVPAHHRPVGDDPEREVATYTNAAGDPYFDRVISTDSVRRLKPAKEPYLAVAEAYEVDVREVRLVAAHSWDIAGA
jgi:FMN phosphatase YigB (HAD superfamily)